MTTVPAFRAAGTGQSDGATSVVIAKPSGAVEGDFCFALITYDSGPAQNFTHAEWTEFSEGSFGFASRRYDLLYRVLDASEPSSWTFTCDNAVTACLGDIVAYYDGELGTPTVSGGDDTGGNVVAPDTMTILTAVDDGSVNRLVLYFGGEVRSSGSGTVSVTSPASERVDHNGTALGWEGKSQFICDEVVGGGAYPAQDFTVSLSSPGNIGAAVLRVKYLFVGVDDARAEGEQIDLRLLKVEVQELPFMLHTRMGDF